MIDVSVWYFLGKPLSSWLPILGAIAWAVGGLAGGMLISWISRNVLRRLFMKTKTRTDDIVLRVMEKPLVFIVFLLCLRQALAVVSAAPAVPPWADKTIDILLVGAVAWIVARALDGIIHEYLVPYVEKTESRLDDQLLPIARNVVKAGIWIVAGIVAIKEAGYDIGAILTGLGIGGVAVALAAKDTLSNFFGSVAIFVDKPFKINDRIKIAGYDGFVVEIGMRVSRLRTLDNRIVTLPNSSFTAGAIENVSSEPNTRVAQVIELALSNGSEGIHKAIALLLEAAAKTEGLDTGTVAALMGFGDSSAKVNFVVFLKKDADYFATLNMVYLKAFAALDGAGIRFAMPIRVVMEGEAASQVSAVKEGKTGRGRGLSKGVGASG